MSDPAGPDVYETPDVPDVVAPEHAAAAAGAAEGAGDVSQDIDRKPLRLRHALTTFAGASWGSEEARASRHYEVDMRSRLPHESPLERFVRLQREVQALAVDLNAVAASAEGDAGAGPGVDLSRGVQELHQQLAALQTAERTRALLDPARQAFPGLDRHEALSRQLAHQVQAAAAAAAAASEAGGEADVAAAPGGGATYELFVSPAEAAAARVARLAALEQRLNALEQRVGAGGAFDTTTADGSAADVASGALARGASLAQAVAELEAHVGLMTPSVMDSVARHAQVLRSEFEALQSQRASTSEAAPAPDAGERKVEQLFDAVQRWDGFAQSLPQLLSRLRALRLLHEEAALFSQRLLQLERSQEAVEELLRGDSSLIHEMEASLADNMRRVQENVEAMDQRMAALAQKLGGQ